ncbi:hypothetical protein LPJ66_004937 [Kickxella alabastrina]|uniref:Uncharacterized protein n=1 Tax=Kickxella alabastrina TaxID=61397 RepID=A0ACC1IK97_9FUNG|nr:hypothetical protein LPJ66_004937 [Kickxella alabastrina]
MSDNKDTSRSANNLQGQPPLYSNNNNNGNNGAQYAPPSGAPPPAGFVSSHGGQAPPPPGAAGYGGHQDQQFGYDYGQNTRPAAPQDDTRSNSIANTGLQWVSASNNHIPPNPVQGGIEKDGKPLFVARAMYKGGLHPGKVGQHLERGGCNIGWGHKEIAVTDYQVLCGDASKLRWVRQVGALNIQNFKPYPAGHEETGEPLYIAKTLYEGSQQLGKCAPHIKKGMAFPYGHKERDCSEYMVLAYAD